MRLLGAVAVVIGLGLIRPAPVPRASGSLPHEAYVWQRARSAAVTEAVSAHAAELDGLAFLAAEVSWVGGAPRVAHAPLEPARGAHAGNHGTGRDTNGGWRGHAVPGWRL